MSSDDDDTFQLSLDDNTSQSSEDDIISQSWITNDDIGSQPWISVDNSRKMRQNVNKLFSRNADPAMEEYIKELCLGETNEMCPTFVRRGGNINFRKYVVYKVLKLISEHDGYCSDEECTLETRNEYVIDNVDCGVRKKGEVINYICNCHPKWWGYNNCKLSKSCEKWGLGRHECEHIVVSYHIIDRKMIESEIIEEQTHNSNSRFSFLPRDMINQIISFL